jgi:hypothetical protein
VPWWRRFTEPSAVGQAGRGGHGGQSAHPEVRMHDVGRLVGPLALQHPREGRHVREQPVLGQAPGRAGVHVRHVVTVLDHHPVRQRLVVPPGVHGDLVPPAGETGGERGHVHVLSAGVHPADRGERAGVLADQVDPHRVTS